MQSFYRPHRRVTAPDGAVHKVDRKTGEVTVIPLASMTKQEFVAECDINNIIKAFKRTGQINHVSAAAASGVFDDLPDPVDFQEAHHITMRAGEAFMALPAKLRDRFHNQPQAFLEFCSNPANAQELRELGLANPLPRPSGGPPQDPAPPDAAESSNT